jgi:hypothetical protein
MTMPSFLFPALSFLIPALGLLLALLCNALVDPSRRDWGDKPEDVRLRLGRQRP